MPGKNAVALCLMLVGAAAAQPALPSFVDQHWDDQTRFRFWFINQGSRIMPLDWFLRLKLAHSSQDFVSGLERYGFIPVDATTASGNPSTEKNKPLPIGFAKDAPAGELPWVGLTCAACHTNKITSGTRSWIVEGGPSMLNFDLFLSDLVAAVDDITPGSATAKAFWNGAPTPEQQALFDKVKASLDQRKRVNIPQSPAGFGRVDAFGHIFNEVITQGLKTETGVQEPNAPASYPFLWDISQHKFVQWNLSAPNLGVGETAVGSLSRNIGEVLGVFGDFEVTTARTGMGLPTYKASANTANLKTIEGWVSNLRAPKWPEELGHINEDQRAKGQQIYQQQCIHCHAVVDPKKEVPHPLPVQPIRLAEVRTDSQELDNFNRTVDAGILRGRFYPLDPRHPFFTKDTLVRDLTGYIATGVYVHAENPSVWTILQTQVRNTLNGLPIVGYYKARPLDGIWATAPYLHNGSVSSLMELLTPEDARLEKFCVGDGEFDPDNVGYKTYARKTGPHEVQLNCPARGSVVDTTTTGSHKSGHNYGTGLPPESRRQLLEYLKSL